MPNNTSVQDQACMAWLTIARGYAFLAGLLPEPCRSYYHDRAEMAFDMAYLCAQQEWPAQ